MLTKNKKPKTEEIPEGWGIKTLGEVSTDISYGYTTSATNIPDGPKFLRITDIQGDHVDWNSVPYCCIRSEDKNKYQLDIGDVCIARTGASTGTNYTIKEKVDAVFASYLIRYKIDKTMADPFYIGFLLKSPKWKDFVASIIGGSAQPGANAKQFASFEFILPSLPEQRAITKILSDLDAKIELSHQMNKTLEQIAQAIFKKWFVDNVNHEWGRGKLVDICEKITKGTTPTTLKKGFVEKGINFIKVESIDEFGNLLQNKFAHIDNATNTLLSRSIIQENDILYTIAGTIGRTAVATQEVLPANTNQAVAIIRLKNKLLYLSYIRLLLKTTNIAEKFQSKVVHAVQPNLSLGEISKTEILIPDEQILTKFNMQVDSVFQKMRQNTIQNSSLLEIRNSLLPRLMSGKIRVN